VGFLFRRVGHASPPLEMFGCVIAEILCRASAAPMPRGKVAALPVLKYHIANHLNSLESLFVLDRSRDRS
jgi:hypothetical protein